MWLNHYICGSAMKGLVQIAGDSGCHLKGYKHGSSQVALDFVHKQPKGEGNQGVPRLPLWVESISGDGGINLGFFFASVFPNPWPEGSSTLSSLIPCTFCVGVKDVVEILKR